MNKNIDMHQKIKEYFEKTSIIEDQLSRILTIHLYCEYWIDKLIEVFSPIGKDIIKNKNYTFSIKLTIIYSMKLIPKELYLNINSLNKIRNKFAHNLDFSIENGDLIFHEDFGEICCINLKDYNNTLQQKISMIGALTYEWLAIHSINLIKTKER